MATASDELLSLRHTLNQFFNQAEEDVSGRSSIDVQQLPAAESVLSPIVTVLSAQRPARAPAAAGSISKLSVSSPAAVLSTSLADIVKDGDLNRSLSVGDASLDDLNSSVGSTGSSATTSVKIRLNAIKQQAIQRLRAQSSAAADESLPHFSLESSPVSTYAPASGSASAIVSQSNSNLPSNATSPKVLTANNTHPHAPRPPLPYNMQRSTSASVRNRISQKQQAAADGSNGQSQHQKGSHSIFNVSSPSPYDESSDDGSVNTSVPTVIVPSFSLAGLTSDGSASEVENYDPGSETNSLTTSTRSIDTTRSLRHIQHRARQLSLSVKQTKVKARMQHQRALSSATEEPHAAATHEPRSASQQRPHMHDRASLPSSFSNYSDDVHEVDDPMAGSQSVKLTSRSVAPQQQKQLLQSASFTARPIAPQAYNPPPHPSSGAYARPASLPVQPQPSPTMPAFADRNTSSRTSLRSDHTYATEQTDSTTPPTQGDSSVGASSFRSRHNRMKQLSLSVKTEKRISKLGSMTRESPGEPASAMSSLAGTDDSQYTPTEQLQPCANPVDLLKHTLKNIKSTEWNARFEALTNLRRLIVCHGFATIQSCCKQVCLDLKTEIDSLRSSLSKNAMLACVDLFTAAGKQLETTELEPLVPALLKRAGESSFLADEAHRSLSTLCQQGHDQRVLLLLLQGAGGSKTVKQMSSIYIDRLIELYPAKMAKSKEYEKLLRVVAVFSADASTVSRGRGRASLLRLQAVAGSAEFLKQCERILPAAQFNSVQTLLTKLRGQSPEPYIYLPCIPVLPQQPAYNPREPQSARVFPTSQQHQQSHMQQPMPAPLSVRRRAQSAFFCGEESEEMQYSNAHTNNSFTHRHQSAAMMGHHHQPSVPALNSSDMTPLSPLHSPTSAPIRLQRSRAVKPPRKAPTGRTQRSDSMQLPDSGYTPAAYTSDVLSPTSASEYADNEFSPTQYDQAQSDAPQRHFWQQPNNNSNQQEPQTAYTTARPPSRVTSATRRSVSNPQRRPSVSKHRPKSRHSQPYDDDNAELQYDNEPDLTNHDQATSRQRTRRTGDKPQPSRLQQLLHSLTASDYKARVVALTSIADYVVLHPAASVSDASTLLQCFSTALHDNHQMVQLEAMQQLFTVVSILGDHMESSLKSILSCIAEHLRAKPNQQADNFSLSTSSNNSFASGANTSLIAAAADLFAALRHNVCLTLLVQPLSSLAMTSNSPSRQWAVDQLHSLLPEAWENDAHVQSAASNQPSIDYVVKRHVLPVAFQLLDDHRMKPYESMRPSLNRLLGLLYWLLNTALLDTQLLASHRLTATQQAKLTNMLMT